MGQATFGDAVIEKPAVAIEETATLVQETQFVDEGARNAIQQLDGYFISFQKSVIADLQTIAKNINEKTKVIDNLSTHIDLLGKGGEIQYESTRQAEKDFEAFKKYAEYEISKIGESVEDRLAEISLAPIPAVETVVQETIVVKPPKVLWALVALNIILVTTILIRG